MVQHGLVVCDNLPVGVELGAGQRLGEFEQGIRPIQRGYDGQLLKLGGLDDTLLGLNVETLGYAEGRVCRIGLRH